MKQAGVTLCFFILLFAQSFSKNFNQNIRGVITDDDSKLPIAGATVAIAGSNSFKA